MKLAECDVILFILVPGHTGIYGNETSWSVSQTRLLTSTYRTSAYTWYICKGCYGGYQERDKQETWGALEVQRQAKGFLKQNILCKKKNWELLNLSRNRLRILTGLATGHSYLKKHLFKPGLVHSPMCDRWQQAFEMASHILCDCKGLANWVVVVWNQVTLKTSARYCTLFKVWDCWMNELKGCTKDWAWSKCAVCCGHCPSVFYTILFYSKCQFHLPFLNIVKVQSEHTNQLNALCSYSNKT